MTIALTFLSLKHKTKYKESELLSDSICKLFVTLAAAQRTAFDAVVADHAQSLSTSLQVLNDPESTFEKFNVILAGSVIPDAKQDVYQVNCKQHLKDEVVLFKKLDKSCLHARYMLDLVPVPFGAGRELLRVMRERNRVNKQNRRRYQ